MNRKIRILQSMDTIGVGGTEAFVINLYRSIDKTKFQFDFVVYDDYKTEYLDEVLNNGDRVYQFHQQHSNRIQNFIDQKKYVSSILDDVKYDIVHCNGNSFLGILRAALPAKKNGVHIITHSHNQGEKHDNIIERIGCEYLKNRISSLAELGYTCSDKAGESKYTEKLISSEKYKIIDNGIDSKKYSFSIDYRRKIREELGIGDDIFLIGHVGRFEYPKNQSYLLDIFASVLRKQPKSRLVLVGDGIQRAELEEKISRLKIEDNVILTGLRMDVNEIYSALDLLVLPSIHEGFPFVLVEAQMNGLQCIVTSNITKEVNISGGVSFLSPNLEPKEWAEKIINTKRRLYDEEVMRVINRYDIRIITSSIENDYIKLVENKNI